MTSDKTPDHDVKHETASDVWLPPARELAEYPPAFVDSVIKMAETQQIHRHQLEEKALQANIALRKIELSLEARGQAFAFCIGIVALLIGATLGWKGSQITASVIGGGGVIGLVTAFLRSSSTVPAPQLSDSQKKAGKQTAPQSPPTG
jgi:uncharacterized membrane protein